MSPSDPFSEFGDDDRTIIRPSPGGRRRQPPASSPAHVSVPDIDERKFRAGDMEGSNPLISCSFALLSLVTKLRNLPQHNAISELQQQLVGEIKSFETRALQKGASRNQVDITKHFLCSLIDETVLNTPWGHSGGWANNSLSNLFFKEVRGGEKFFQILDRLKQQPAQHLNLLQFAYLCLSLGFEGKYRNADNGAHILEKERQELYLLAQRLKGDAPPELSIHWQGMRDLRNPLSRYVPFWVLVVVAGALLMLVYMGYALAIRGTTDRVYDELIAMAQKVDETKPIQTLRPVQQQKLPSSVTDRFRKLLAGEIAQNQVEVLDGPILRIFNSYPSGRARIKKEFRPMLAKISRELQNGASRIVVIGHTDNQKIKFSARFKSNWHLSRARAENAANILNSNGILGKRVSFEGMADKDPIAPNDTKKNRALNRRIDIHIR
jgi:type VI secretion system protein ImpK